MSKDEKIARLLSLYIQWKGLKQGPGCPPIPRFGQYALNLEPAFCGQGDHMIFYETDHKKAYDLIKESLT